MQAFTRWFRRQSSWIESQQATILSAAFIIFIAAILSALFGLIRTRVLLSAYLGEDRALLDSYWVAFRLPELIYQIIVLGTVSAALVPIFTKLYKEDEAAAYGLSRQAMLVLIGIFFIGSVVVYFFAPGLIALLTGPEFTAENVSLAVELTRIMLLAQMFFAVSGFFSAMLQSLKRFVLPAFSPVFYNLGIILFVLLFSDQLGLHAAAWGTVFGAFLHAAIQYPLLRKCGFQLIGPISWNWRKLRELFWRAGPRTIALSIEQLNTLAVTFFATSIRGEITLTITTMAQQLMALPIRFFGASIAQAALPFFSANAHDSAGLRKMVFRSIQQIAFFVTPAATLLLILRVATVRLAFGVAEFPWKDTLETAAMLGILAVSIPSQAVTLLLVRAFYALDNTVVPFLTSTLYFISSILLCWYLVFTLQWGVIGIAVALTTSGILEMLVLFLVFLIHNRFRDFAPFLWSLFRIAAASILMGITLFIFQRLFDLYVFETSLVLQLIGLTIVVGSLGSIVYFGFCWMLKIEELTILQRIFHKLRSQWNKVVGTTPDFVESVSPGDQVS